MQISKLYWLSGSSQHAQYPCECLEKLVWYGMVLRIVVKKGAALLISCPSSHSWYPCGSNPPIAVLHKQQILKLSQIKRWIWNYVLPHKCKLIKYNTNTIFIHEFHSNIASDTKMTTSKCTNLPPCQIFNNWPVFSKQTHNATHSLNVTHKNINHRNEETIIMISTMYMISQWHSLNVILRKNIMLCYFSWLKLTSAIILSYT